jgi:hypothetical protein
VGVGLRWGFDSRFERAVFAPRRVSADVELPVDLDAVLRGPYDDAGSAAVERLAGATFYRVDRGEHFVVVDVEWVRSADRDRLFPVLWTVYEDRTVRDHRPDDLSRHPTTHDPAFTFPFDPGAVLEEHRAAYDDRPRGTSGRPVWVTRPEDRPRHEDHPDESYHGAFGLRVVPDFSRSDGAEWLVSVQLYRPEDEEEEGRAFGRVGPSFTFDVVDHGASVLDALADGPPTTPTALDDGDPPVLRLGPPEAFDWSFAAPVVCVLAVQSPTGPRYVPVHDGEFDALVEVLRSVLDRFG